MQKKIKLTIENENTGKRTDVFVSETSGITRSNAVKLIEGGFVLINGKAPVKNYRLKLDDIAEITVPEPERLESKAQDIPIDVVYEDEHIIVVNKRSGMVVHPAAGNREGTLVNALLYRCGNSLSGIGGVIRPGIVHRLDKDTSGLLLVAKTDSAHLELSRQLKNHEISRVYHAIIIGGTKNDCGNIDYPIGRNPNDRKKMAVILNAETRSRSAVTHYNVLERFDGFSYMRFELETGRTHQIRVHMSYIGHPILGDALYGGNKTKFEASNMRLINGQCLHAKELTFIHPESKKLMHFECPLPDDFQALLEKLRTQKSF